MFKQARIALVLLAALLMLAACSNSPATPSPTPTIGPPTATPTLSPPTPTPTPQPPSVSEALANASAALAELDAHRFSLSVTQANAPQMDASGIWIAPGSYDVSISLPVCPPSVPGAPSPSDCLFLPVYRELKSEGIVYGRPPIDSDGEWASGSELSRFDLGFLNEELSPAQHLLNTIDFTGEVFVSEGNVDGTPSYQIIVTRGSDQATWVHIKRDSSALLTVVLTSGESKQAWGFTSHDEALAIPQPVANDTIDPLEWLERKTIRLVEDDPSFATVSLRPFSGTDAPTVSVLAKALSTGTAIHHDDFQTTGRVLTVHFTDGSRFTVSQAARKATDTRVADHWFLGAPSPIVVRSAKLTSWWSAIDDHFATVVVVVWPDSLALDEPARFSGQGWPDEIVVLSTDVDGHKVEFGEARTAQGGWEWEGPVPEGVQPGLREFRASVKHPATFERRPETKRIAVRVPAAFAVDGRQVHVVYATDGPSPLPAGAPLWVGRPEHHDSILRLLSTINDAAKVDAPSTDVDHTSSLHIGHADGTETLLHFAGDCGVVTPTTVCSDNRWTLSHVNQNGTQTSPTTAIDSSHLSAWWRQLTIIMPPVEPLVIPEAIGTSDVITISGQGWPTGDGLTIQITGQATELVTAYVSLYFGGYSTSIDHLTSRPGPLEITVKGTGANAPSVTRSTRYP